LGVRQRRFGRAEPGLERFLGRFGHHDGLRMVRGDSRSVLEPRLPGDRRPRRDGLLAVTHRGPPQRERRASRDSTQLGARESGEAVANAQEWSFVASCPGSRST
jgi:hypothetical protein